MEPQTQAQIDGLIQFIENAEDPATVTNEIVAAVLKYLMNKAKEVDGLDIDSRINRLSSTLDALVSGNAANTIESFNEVIEFLAGVTDDETLTGLLLNLHNEIADKASKAGDGRLDPKDATVVMLDSMGSTIDSVGSTTTVMHVVAQGDYIFSAGAIKYYKTYYGTGGPGNDVVYLGPPQQGLIYCNKKTGLQYRWAGSDTGWVQVGGGRVINDLTTGGESVSLSAEQGKVLKQLLDNVNVPLVNNLDEGGIDVALSAEMGKRVAGREATDRQRIDAIVAILKKSVFTESQTDAFAALDALGNGIDSISFNASSHKFTGIGDTFTLSVVTDPAGKTAQISSWSSSNTSVATVNDGVVTSVADGDAVITATTTDGKSATCTITVSIFVVDSVTINGDDLINKVLTSNGETYGTTHQLSAVTDPTGGDISWISTNESVATVNNGLVTIVGNGTATITASSGGKSDSITVNVSSLTITSISLNKQSLSFSGADETEILIATTVPANAPVTWTSSNDAVATVNNGVVTSVGNGQCTITATCFDKTATCTVNVQALPAGFQKNKAWNKIASTGSEGGVTFYDGEPIASEGYCITPFYDILSSNNEGGIVYSKYGIKVKAGFTADHEVDGTHVDGDVDDGCVAFKNSSETHIVSRVIQSADPKFLTNSANASRKVSATFKISELDNCYIYDFVKAARQGTQSGYLFAGSNIDTSVAPTKDDNTDNNTLN